DDDEFAAELAMLRQVMRDLSQATVEGRPVAAPERERRRLEDEVRGHVLRTSGGAANADAQHLDMGRVLAALGETRLVEIVNLDGRIHVLVATSAGVRRHVAGTWDDAVRTAQFRRFVLRRFASRTTPDPAISTPGGIRTALAPTRLASRGTLRTRLQ